MKHSFKTTSYNSRWKLTKYLNCPNSFYLTFPIEEDAVKIVEYLKQLPGHTIVILDSTTCQLMEAYFVTTIEEKELFRKLKTDLCIPDSSKAFKPEGNRRKVYKYSLTGKLLEEYPSVLAASSATCINHSTIWHACEDNRISKGFLWSFEPPENLPVEAPSEPVEPLKS